MWSYVAAATWVALKGYHQGLDHVVTGPRAAGGSSTCSTSVRVAPGGMSIVAVKTGRPRSVSDDRKVGLPSRVGLLKWAPLVA